MIRPLCDSIVELLWITRQNAKRKSEVALGGIFQLQFDRENPCQLVRGLHFSEAQAVESSMNSGDAMTTTKQITRAMVAVAAVYFAHAAKASDQSTAQAAAQPGSQIAAAAAPATDAVNREIVVSLEDRKLALVQDGQVVKVYSVAVGKPSTPSPEGTFAIEHRVANPTYHHDGKTIPPGPGNPVGTRWMGLSIKGYGIHGTNEPKSIGKAASHGCIRMAKADLEELYPLVQVGDKVELVGHRDEETARLFGDGSAPAAAVNAELAAKTASPSATATTRNAAGVQVPAAHNGAELATAAILTGAL